MVVKNQQKKSIYEIRCLLFGYLEISHQTMASLAHSNGYYVSKKQYINTLQLARCSAVHCSAVWHLHLINVNVCTSSSVHVRILLNLSCPTTRIFLFSLFFSLFQEKSNLKTVSKALTHKFYALAWCLFFFLSVLSHLVGIGHRFLVYQ